MLSILRISRKLPPSVKWRLLDVRKYAVLLRNKILSFLHGQRYLYRCPCCGARFSAFQSGNYRNHPERYCAERYANVRQDVLCPACLALPRHRILAQWCEDNRNDLRECRILTFAAEYGLSLWLRRHGIKNTTADLYQSAALQIDIEDTKQPDASWDVIFCNHVLEHVGDYRKALKELYRILSPGGRLLCSFPIDNNCKTVCELLPENLDGLTIAEARKKAFGQSDHLRVFGRDSAQILQSTGFSVTPIMGDEMPPEILPVVGPADYDANVIFCCEKPVQGLYHVLVSVVIPVYNVLPYLDRCIMSVTKQSYPRLEIILVDDGSTDGSGERCDEWAGIDSRISVIHQNNKGLSAARNAGLTVARGDYLCFVDSDDCIHRDMIRRMLDKAELEKADIVVCEYESEKKTRPSFDRRVEISYSGLEAARELLQCHSAGVAVWNKLYRSRLKGQLHFAEGHVYEGKVPLFCSILHAEKVLFLPDKLYYYTSRSDSISKKITLSKEQDRILSVQQLETVINELAPKLKPELNRYKLLLYAYTWMRLQFCEGNPAQEYARSLHDYLRSHKKELGSGKMIQTLAGWLSIYAPGLARRCYRIYCRYSDASYTGVVSVTDSIAQKP